MGFGCEFNGRGVCKSALWNPRVNKKRNKCKELERIIGKWKMVKMGKKLNIDEMNCRVDIVT